jgi:hypothetical protein
VHVFVSAASIAARSFLYTEKKIIALQFLAISNFLNGGHFFFTVSLGWKVLLGIWCARAQPQIPDRL